MCTLRSSVAALALAVTCSAVEYEMILNHIDYRNGLFSSSLPLTGLENENNASANTYSIIGTFNDSKRSHYRDVDGAYQFKLLFFLKNDIVDTLIWKQTSWITVSTITGFAPISATGSDGTVFDVHQYSGIEACYNFQGLGLNVGFHSSYYWLDGNGAAYDQFYQSVGYVSDTLPAYFLGAKGIPGMYQRGVLTNWAIGQTLYIATVPSGTPTVAPTTPPSSSPTRFPPTTSPSITQTVSPTATPLETSQPSSYPTRSSAGLPTTSPEVDDTDDEGEAQDTDFDTTTSRSAMDQQGNNSGQMNDHWVIAVIGVSSVVCICCVFGCIVLTKLRQNRANNEKILVGEHERSESQADEKHIEKKRNAHGGSQHELQRNADFMDAKKIHQKSRTNAAGKDSANGVDEFASSSRTKPEAGNLNVEMSSMTTSPVSSENHTVLEIGIAKATQGRLSSNAKDARVREISEAESMYVAVSVPETNQTMTTDTESGNAVEVDKLEKNDEVNIDAGNGEMNDGRAEGEDDGIPVTVTSE